VALARVLQRGDDQFLRFDYQTLWLVSAFSSIGS
jgi:hypothetical protein